MKNINLKRDYKSLVNKPRKTEKSGIKSESENVYTFEVSSKASKITVAKAIEAIYKVKPIKINIINLPAKKTFSRGKAGIKQGVKKAVVFLKKEDKIAFI